MKDCAREMTKRRLGRDVQTGPTLGECALRALLYAIAILALIVFAPGSEHVFIYQGF